MRRKGHAGVRWRSGVGRGGALGGEVGQLLHQAYMTAVESDRVVRRTWAYELGG